MKHREVKPYLVLIAAAALIGGCSNPASKGIKIAVKVVGKAVDEAKVKDLEEKLLGQEHGAADRELGERVDVIRDLHHERYWILYAVGFDPLNKHRYMVEVANERIVAIAKIEESGRSKADIPREIVLKEKVKGKSPAECQAELDMGPPLLEVRRDSTQQLAQLYDARVIKGLGGIYYCVVRYDEHDRCDDLDFVSVEAATKDDITEK